MNKSILLSVKPKYVADILNGKKTIEIRKTMPKCDLPVDVYIYCTKDSKTNALKTTWTKDVAFPYSVLLNGKVVAKFTLNKAEELIPVTNITRGRITLFRGRPQGITHRELLESSCLSNHEIINYLKDSKQGYAWHISNLVIFDEPKELSEFKSYKKNIVNTKINGMVFETELDNSLIKAPQSWCYVEVE